MGQDRQPECCRLGHCRSSQLQDTPWGTGVLTGNTPNTELTWETTTSWNLGLDFGVLDNRIELVADIYYKKTNNLLLQVQIPGFVGSSGHGAASNPWDNVGSIENKGVELTLNTTNISNRDFQWTSNVVFGLNRNKVASLDTENATLDKSFQPSSKSLIVTRTVVGQPIGQFYGLKVIGRFDKPTDFYYHDAQGNLCEVARPKGEAIDKAQTWLGDYIYEDVNGDGVIDAGDYQFIGNPEPKFTWGFGNTFSWKGLDLTVFFQGSYGGKALNLTRMRIENPRDNNNILRSSLNYARVGKLDPNGPDDDFRNLYVINSGSTDMIGLTLNASNYAYNEVSDRFIEDASYIRLQNISLGYTLPRPVVRKICLDNVRVYCNIQNVYT